MKRNVLIASLVASSSLAFFILWGSETVPFSKRYRFMVLMPRSLENLLSDLMFKLIWKKEFEKYRLPENEPMTVRAKLIANNIIKAYERSLKLNAPEEFDANTSEGNLMSSWKKKASKSASTDAFNWEVIVIRDRQVNASVFPGGRIMVYTGMLDYFKTDAEIAYVMAHEVAHVVARHSAEQVTQLAVLHSILIILDLPIVSIFYSLYHWMCPSSAHWMEFEADYIGMILMALAGYDPRTAIKAEEKLSYLDTSAESHSSTHPSSKQRNEALSQPKYMEEAMSLYEDSDQIRIQAKCVFSAIDYFIAAAASVVTIFILSR